MREMRLNKREIKDPDMLRDIIESCDIVRLGLRDRDGMFIVPVNYEADPLYPRSKGRPESGSFCC